MAFTLLILFLSMVIHTFVTADNTTDYIHQLEQKISDIESHNQASEQKQAAVLASILSKLQAQEEKIQELTEDLENITTNSNSTTTVIGGKRVAFEAITTREVKSSLIHFHQVRLNDGDGYDEQRGTFVAPTAGTYQFWFNAYVSAQSVQYSVRPNIIVLDVQGTTYGGYLSPFQLPKVGQPNTIQSEVRLVQGLYAVSLTSGDNVSVRLEITGRVRAGSSFGGMLLR